MNTDDKIFNNYIEMMQKYFDDVWDLNAINPPTRQILKNMRILHGKAIILRDAYINFVKTQPPSNHTDDAFFDISKSTCMLSVIHKKVKDTEIKLHKQEKEHDVQKHMPTDRKKNHRVDNPNITYNKKGEAEIVLHTPQTTPMHPMHPMHPIGSTHSPVLSGGLDTDSNDYLEFSIGGRNPLSTEESGYKKVISGGEETEGFLQQFLSLGPKRERTSAKPTEAAAVSGPTMTVGKIQSKSNDKVSASDLSVTKPTIVNYWGNWCPASRQFRPKWEEIKEKVTTEYPHIQVVDIDIPKASNLSKLIKNIGITAYPTVIFYQNGSQMDKLVGNNDIKDVLAFIKSTYIK